jgi:hypothetical protein
MVNHSDEKDEGMIQLINQTLHALKYINNRRTKPPPLTDDGIQGLSKHVGGDFVHLLYEYVQEHVIMVS